MVPSINVLGLGIDWGGFLFCILFGLVPSEINLASRAFVWKRLLPSQGQSVDPTEHTMTAPNAVIVSGRLCVFRQ